MSTRFDDPAAGEPPRRARAVQLAEAGEHLCSFHTSDGEQRRLASALVAGAMGAGERVIYVGDDVSPDEVATFLEESGVPARELLSGGQLAVMSFDSFYGSASEMDVDAMLAVYRREADRSRSAGFPSTRVAVNMKGAVEALGSVERLAQCESIVGRMFEDVGITAVCQYDGRRFSAVERERLVSEHAAVATDDGTMPLATFTAGATADVLRVAGEVDVSTAPRLARALRARAATSERVAVDLSAVTFIDVAALRMIFEVAHDLPADSVLALRRPSNPVRRLLELVRWRHPRVEVHPR